MEVELSTKVRKGYREGEEEEEGEEVVVVPC